ncbi:MAG TPA: tetratricopeptide repeat protein [Arenimonas sp.]|nr:tetratricopeptide repeat protein [Arenimonas sp.]
MSIRFSALLLVTVLAGCASTPDAPPRQAKQAKQTPPHELVRAVRAAGVSGVELEVQPLRDPQVEDLRNLADSLESAGRFGDADAALQQALALTPDDPELLQWRAELALLQRDWDQAVALANASYVSGPRLGGLCRRNWTTVELVRVQHRDEPSADVARKRREQCTVAPPVRM